MARVRMFANLRELAGASAVDVDGNTVGDVLSQVAELYGSDFERALDVAQVWVDGNQAGTDSAVGKASEVALIPPVSGGTSSVVRSPLLLELGLALGVAAALFVTNAISLEAFSAAVVLAGGVWAYDVGDVAARRGLPVAIGPAIMGVTGGVIATYRFGVPGMSVAIVGAVVASLTWSVFFARLRPIESVAAGAAMAIAGTSGAAAMVLIRLRSQDEALAFLVVGFVAVAVSWLAARSNNSPVDPLVTLILVAVFSGVVAGLVWAPDTLSTVAAAVAAAIALVAGKNLGTLLRAGGFFIDGVVPGALHQFDGVIVAAAPFWFLLSVLD